MERRCFLSSASSFETTATITTRKCSSWVNVATTHCHTRPDASAARSLARRLAIVLLVVLVFAFVTGGISAISSATANNEGVASCLLSVVAFSFGWVVTILLHWYWQQEALGGLYMGMIVPLFLALLASVALILKFGSTTSHSTIVFPWLPLICYTTLRLCCKRGDEYRHWGWPCNREENLLEGEVDLMV